MGQLIQRRGLPTSVIANGTPCRTHFSHAPTAAQRFDVAVQTLKNTCETETCLGSKRSSTAASVNWVMRQAASGRVKLRDSSWVAPGATCSWRALEVRSLEDHQSVFRTLWRVHRRWSLAIPDEFRTPVSHEIVSSVATSAWVHHVPRTFLLSFHCLLRPAEARQLPWWKLLMDHCRHVTNKFMESLTSEIPKRAGWQVMQPSNTCFWTVLTISQLVESMISSIPDRCLDATSWTRIAAQHFAYAKRQLRNLGEPHQRCTWLRTSRRWSFRPSDAGPL